MTQAQIGTEAQVGVRLALNEATDELYLIHLDTQETLITMTADAAHRISATINPDAQQIDLTNAALRTPVSTTPQGGAPAGITRNWRIDGDEFVCWYNGRDVRVKIAPTPGPNTPMGNIPEVFGQDRMLFTLIAGIAEGSHVLLSGPTGTAKTTVYAWIAQKLNYNFIVMPMSGSTEAAHMIGEYLPAPAGDGSFGVSWTDGPVTKAVRLSQKHPTILLFDEVNRIRNMAEVARLYSLLDGQKFIELVEKRNGTDEVEFLKAGDIFIGGTMNPADDGAADYSGVLELDPAFMSRFGLHPPIGYPDLDIEIRTLVSRVAGLSSANATKMVNAARRIRESVEVRFPISFRELEAWGKMLRYMDYDEAAEVTVVQKAHADTRPSVRNLLKLQG
jgi:MoxR-like ATPase